MGCTANATQRPVRVAIYTRAGVAADMTQGGLSEDAQLARCVRWCDDNYGGLGYQLGLFTDSGLSANLSWEPSPDGRFRPALRNLVKAVSEGQVDVVVVRTLDRLSRSVMLHHRFVEKVLKPHGIALVVAEGNIAPPVV